MKNENEKSDEKYQLNLALEQRIANRDYHEYFIPGSIKLALTTWPKIKLDSLARENERMFRYRFGFMASHVVRGKLIDFQNKYDLSDSEIRWLKRAGHIQITRTEMKIDSSRVMPIYGWIQLIMLSLIFAGTIVHVGYSAEPEWKRILGQVALGTCWLGSGALLLKMFVLPWQTLKFSGAVDAGKKTPEDNTSTH